MENFTRARPCLIDAAQLRQLYNTALMFNAGAQGTGRTIGISNYDGFRISNLAQTFTVTTKTVTASKTIQIGAKFLLESKTATLTVNK